ncbi:WRKY domain [Dillenia turbinata]|uniref:WRKY domain n=1 Tax=Dillenia turbinata TaxID=194707 RepID=A0AAN8ZBS1_9MAGN
MENYQGDLADIVRASGGVITSNSDDPINEWQFPSSDPTNYESTDDFGDPFSNMRDPLLHDLDMSSSTGFFNNSTDHLMKSTGRHEDYITSSTSCSSSNHTSSILALQKIDDHEMKRPCNIFSRMLQISTTSANNNDLSLPISPPCEPPVMTASSSSSSPSGLVGADHMLNKVESGGVQISSPRNPGIKRRKSQAKKVVCIPAPAAANSRPSGEVVPSDLWAWRKYGQKPIKGSPYPRGYYRCSSSKGCSARKQVERSRTDPNMLVITYTSEHNHPWPTQRNALAGSTRSQPSKNTSNSKNSPNSQSQKQSCGLKEEQHKENTSSNTVASAGGGVKEEMEGMEKQLEIEEGELSEGFHQSYKPTMPDQLNQHHQTEDFFADLGELEGDPLDLLFTQGFTPDHEGENKVIDPFSIFGWTSNDNNNNATSFGEDNRAGQ